MRIHPTRWFMLIITLLALNGCTGTSDKAAVVTTEEPDIFMYHFTPQDTAIAREMRVSLERGRDHIESFFDRPFRHPLHVIICPDREAFTATFPPEWGLTETQCWMVATGVAEGLTILSPRIWGEQACEHDPDDRQHLEGIVHHELLHVYHGQHNPTGDFTGAEELGWFLEGLAVYVSGQLSEGHLASPREAVELGLDPQSLASAWSGKYRYGICGTLVRHLDRVCGRPKLRAMLACTNQEQLLEMAELGEEELLRGWREDILASRP